MKKIVALALCALLVLSLCACAKKPAPAPENNLPNPMVEYDSLEAINEKLHVKLSHPGVMGVSNEKFFIISDEIADYQFEVNGTAYDFRACPTYDTDISGLYIDGKPAFEGMPTEIVYAEAEGVKAARWGTMDGQYTLAVTDAGTMEKEQFIGIAEELKELTRPGPSDSELAALYQELAGDYQDETSQRAILTVVANADNAAFEVAWSSSAADYTKWTMTVVKTEDGLLSYKDGAKMDIHTDENGKETVDIVATEQDGFFSYVDGKLLWNGAADENCQGCVFAKIPQ